MNGSSSSPQPTALAVFSIETLLRQPIPLPDPLRASLSVPPTHLSDALHGLSLELRALLFECIQAHATAEGLTGPLTLPELRAFVVGDRPDPG